LVGPSGSGKSTLLAILGCLLTADSGDVSICGQSLRNASPAMLSATRRKHIGFVFQRFQLLAGLCAEDNVAIPLSLQGMTAHEARARAGLLLESVGLADRRRSLPSQLSPGQCQRVALARAISTSPAVLLADEPTASLDSHSGQEIMQLLAQLVRGSQTAAVVVTHDPRIRSFADRVCAMQDGQLVEDSS
jgi:putative ABC transport system ATP-binding protein